MSLLTTGKTSRSHIFVTLISKSRGMVLNTNMKSHMGSPAKTTRFERVCVTLKSMENLKIYGKSLMGTWTWECL